MDNNIYHNSQNSEQDIIPEPDILQDSLRLGKNIPAQIIAKKDAAVDEVLQYLQPNAIMDYRIKQELQALRREIDVEKPFEEQPEVLKKILRVLQYLGDKNTARFYEEKYFAESEADRTATAINALVTSAKVPIEGSNVGFYGYEVALTPHELIYTKGTGHGLIDAVENRLYRLDDRGSMLWGKAVRRKLNFPKIAERIETLGLSDSFTFDGEKFHENLDHYDHAVMLDDLLRDAAQPEEKKRTGLAAATKAIMAAHKKSGGGIGEALMNDFLLKTDKKNFVSARLMLPDVAYEGHVSGLEQKATDLIDLCFSAASSAYECHVNEAEEHLLQYLQTILESYNGPDSTNIKLIMATLVLTRPAFNFHSKRRYGFDRTQPPHKEKFEHTRQTVARILENQRK